MKNLVIGTWNVDNSYLLTNRNNYKIDVILELLDSGEIDILALQEVNPLLASKLDKRLEKSDLGYVITSRYDKTKRPIKKVTSEENIIISKLPYLKSKNIELPFFPNDIEKLSDLLEIKDRSVTCQDFIIGSGNLRVYNTRLNKVDETLNMEQFDVVYDKLVRDHLFDKKESILLGTLNVNSKSYNMDYYSTLLSNINMKIVGNSYRTYKGKSNETLDYIIIPDSYEVDRVLCCDTYDRKISAHNPLIVKIKK